MNDINAKEDFEGKTICSFLPTNFSMYNNRMSFFFICRSDVYAVRWESKSEKSGYSPACKYEWHLPIWDIQKQTF